MLTTQARQCSVSARALRHQFSQNDDGNLAGNTLEPNPDAGENKDAPPQRLALAFSTADVVILGWRLGRLADLLRENTLATVHVLSTLCRSRPQQTLRRFHHRHPVQQGFVVGWALTTDRGLTATMGCLFGDGAGMAACSPCVFVVFRLSLASFGLSLRQRT